MMGCDLLDTFVRICSALPDGLDPSNSAICNSLMPTVSTMEPHPRYEEADGTATRHLEFHRDGGTMYAWDSFEMVARRTQTN